MDDGTDSDNLSSSEDSSDALAFFTRRTNALRARMVVDRDNPFYKMDHPERGIALIIHQENYLNYPHRKGTTNDSRRLSSAFKELGFKVEYFKDLSAEDVEKVVDHFASRDYTYSDCFVMCYLSHGQDNGIVFATDYGFSSEKLWTSFTPDKCPTLAGKPKLFFFDVSSPAHDSCDFGETQTDSSPSSYAIPLCADFLLCHSTHEGFSSVSKTAHGSSFIRALCKELKENSDKYDILMMMTCVNSRLLKLHNSSGKGPLKIPSVQVMLIRLVNFNSKAQGLIIYEKLKETAV